MILAVDHDPKERRNMKKLMVSAATSAHCEEQKQASQKTKRRKETKEQHQSGFRGQDGWLVATTTSF
jgi:hypothetical protein